MKKQLFLGLIAAIVLVPAIVFAASYAWVTTLSISSGSTLQGATRDYPYKYHNVWFTPTSAGSGVPHKIKIGVYKSSTFSSTFLTHKTVAYTVGTTVNTDFGNIGTGKHFYIFATYEAAFTETPKGKLPYWANLNANPVTFVSRDYQ